MQDTRKTLVSMLRAFSQACPIVSCKESKVAQNVHIAAYRNMTLSTAFA